MNLKVTLSIARSSDDTIRIEVQDQSSRIRFLEVALTPDQFGRAVTNLVIADLDAEVHGLDGVGKVREVKTELVPFDMYHGCSQDCVTREQSAKWALLPFEVEGWTGRVADMTNWHNRVEREGKAYQSVTFTRLT